MQESAAFSQDFLTFRPLLLSFFAQRGFPAQDCEDLVQITFLQAWNGRKGFREHASFKTWLFTIAKNVARRAIRSRKCGKRKGEEVDLKEAGMETRDGPHLSWRQTNRQASRHAAGVQEEALITHEKLKLAEGALDGLPPRMRRCFVLRVYQERKYREIAAIMGLSINTVKSQIHEARKRLQESLSEHFDDFGH